MNWKQQYEWLEADYESLFWQYMRLARKYKELSDKLAEQKTYESNE